MLENLDRVDWGNLEHAYGRATDAPRWLAALASEDEDEREEAVGGFLNSSVFHQYTLYSATPHVIPFVIELLQYPDVCRRPAFGGPLKRELLNFLRACSSCCRGVPDVEASLLAGAPAYRRFCDDEDEASASVAKTLIAFCDSRSPVE
jgi:hypothetical protein